jgi:hypothetical protein
LQVAGCWLLENGKVVGYWLNVELDQQLTTNIESTFLQPTTKNGFCKLLVVGYWKMEKLLVIGYRLNSINNLQPITSLLSYNQKRFLQVAGCLL